MGLIANVFFFISLRWLDIIDIIIVAILLYQLYNLVKSTVAANIIAGLTSVYILWLFVKALNMQLLNTILGQFIGAGFIVLIIVFQQEIRRFLLLIGSRGFVRSKFFRFLLNWRGAESKPELNIASIVKACKRMAESKTGAIIVIGLRSNLEFYAETGDILDARISSRLIESIFYKNSPLHDGAVLIAHNRVLAARCVLPVTEDNEFPAHLGMRHRAAVGITENNDAIAISVSEQTGSISLCIDGKLNYKVTPEELTAVLEKEFA